MRRETKGIIRWFKLIRDKVTIESTMLKNFWFSVIFFVLAKLFNILFLYYICVANMISAVIFIILAFIVYFWKMYLEHTNNQLLNLKKLSKMSEDDLFYALKSAKDIHLEVLNVLVDEEKEAEEHRYKAAKNLHYWCWTSENEINCRSFRDKKHSIDEIKSFISVQRKKHEELITIFSGDWEMQKMIRERLEWFEKMFFEPMRSKCNLNKE